MAKRIEGGLAITSGPPPARRKIILLLLVPLLVILYGLYSDLQPGGGWFTLGGPTAGLVFLGVLGTLGLYLLWPRQITISIFDSGDILLRDGSRAARREFCALLVVESETSHMVNNRTMTVRRYTVQLVPRSLEGAHVTARQELAPTLEPELNDLPRRLLVMRNISDWDPRNPDTRALKHWLGGPLLHRRHPEGIYETGRTMKDHSDYEQAR